MTWLAWRQHRAEILAAGAVLVALTVILVVLGTSMHAASTTAVACADGSLVDPEVCGPAIDRFQLDYGYAPSLMMLMNLLPFAIGALIGAPLIARELEAGTWQLAWTQAVPRMRWLTVKLVLTAGLTTVVSGAAGALATWYRQPLDAIGGRFGMDGFGVEGLVPGAYGLFAFAVGAAAGALLRRSVPALATALVAFVVVRVFVTAELRPNFVKPFTRVDDIEAGTAGIRIGSGRPGDWTLDWALIQNGQRLTESQLRDLGDAAAAANVAISTYFHDHGVQTAVTYHPASHFWTLQYFEAGVFVALAAGLLAVVVWRVRRRLA
jgi:hypothetical protein